MKRYLIFYLRRIDLVIMFENNTESDEFSHIKIKSADEIFNFTR